MTRTLRTGAYGTRYTFDFGYSYDYLNRLSGCAAGSGVYTYAMDEFGNITARTQTAGGGGNLPQSMALAVSPATNRLAGADYYYDVLGNLVEMPAPDGLNSLFMTYLDQGHIGTLTDSSGVIWKYYYDADGKRRIKVKTAGGAATEPDGQGGVRLVTDHSFYFYEGEDLICQQDAGALVQDESQYEPKFLLLDHLGSTRAELVFDPSTLAPQIQEYYDLMPYGEVIDPPSTPESVLFTGKSRDIESGLDFFGNRYYENPLCRWVSADQPFADSAAETPQSWNLYSYVRNNPIINYDPDGRALDTIVDVAFILYDIGDIAVTAVSGDSVSGTQWTALGADAVGALVPFATGAGIAVRAAAKADDVVDAVILVDKAMEGEKIAVRALDAEKALDKTYDGLKATTPYKRPSGATTAQQRASVQGKPCVDCGAQETKMVADHKTPLVKEHYQTGKIDKKNMRDVNSTQPQCPTCSAKQDGKLSNYSKKMKEQLGKR